MILSDIVALAKQGYKPADIKELMSLKEDTSPMLDNDEGTTTDGAENVTQPVNHNSSDGTNTTPPVPPSVDTIDKEPEIDYKKLYEDTQKKLELAQADNREKNRDTGLPKDTDALVLEMFRNYIS